MLFNGENSPQREFNYFGPRMVAKFVEISKTTDKPSQISDMLAGVMINFAENFARIGQVVAISTSNGTRRISEWQQASSLASIAKNNLRRSRVYRN